MKTKLFSPKLFTFTSLAGLLVVAGCASTPSGGGSAADGSPQGGQPGDGGGISSFFRDVGSTVAQLGGNLQTTINRVFDRNLHSAYLGEASECAGATQGTSLVLESSENDPASVKSGGVFRNTVIAHLCIPQGESRQVVHTLNIVFNDKVVFKGKAFTSKNLTRSRQALYTVVDVAPKAPAGKYEAETIVTVAGKSYTSRTPFMVTGSE